MTPSRRVRYFRARDLAELETRWATVVAAWLKAWRFPAGQARCTLARAWEAKVEGLLTGDQRYDTEGPQGHWGTLHTRGAPCLLEGEGGGPRQDRLGIIGAEILLAALTDLAQALCRASGCPDRQIRLNPADAGAEWRIRGTDKGGTDKAHHHGDGRVKLSMTIGGATLWWWSPVAEGVLPFPTPESARALPPPPRISTLLGQPKTRVAAGIGQATLRYGELTTLKPGTIIKLDRLIDQSIPLLVNGQSVGIYGYIWSKKGRLVMSNFESKAERGSK